MKVAGYYFTGTGNSLDAATVVKERLTAAGHTVTLTDITDPEIGFKGPRVRYEKKIDTGTADLLLLAFPVYSWDVPPVVRSFIRAIDRVPAPAPSGAETPRAGHGTEKSRTGRAAVLAVDGGGGSKAGHIAASLLRKRGYDVFLSARAGYTENWTMFSNPPESAAAAAVNETGRKMAADFAERILENRGGSIEGSGSTGALLRIVGFLFRNLGRKVLAECYAADSDCTGCGICARTCPVQAIRMTGRARSGVPRDARNTAPDNGRKRPRWRPSCQSCNRCINICPEKAINTSIPRLIALVSGMTVLCVLFIMAAGRYIRPLVQSLPVPAGVTALVYAIIVLLVIAASQFIGLAAIPPLMNLIGKIPAVRRSGKRAFTKTYNRYMMAGFKPAARHSQRE